MEKLQKRTKRRSRYNKLYSVRLFIVSDQEQRNIQIQEKTPEQITRLICKDLKIKVKNIAKTKVKIKKMLLQIKNITT